MMKYGAPPDKFGVLYHIYLPTEFHGFTSIINSKGYHSFVPGLISIFRDGMGPFNIKFMFQIASFCCCGYHTESVIFFKLS